MVRMALSLAFCSLFVLTLSGDSSQASSSLTSQLRRIEVNNVGQVIGFEVVISKRPRMSLWVSGPGRIQWLMLSMPRADILIAPTGRVWLGQVQHRGNAVIQFDDLARLARVNRAAFAYQAENRNRLDHIVVPSGTIKILYHTDGRFRQIGNIRLHYLNNGLLKKVLKTTFKYDRSKSRVAKAGALPIRTHMNGRVISIGGAVFRYHSVQGHIVALGGREKRTQIQVLWYNSNNCFGFQRQGGASIPRKSPYPY